MNRGEYMSFTRAKAYLEEQGLADKIHVSEKSTATIPLAAKALGVAEGEIAKSLTFMSDKPIMILCAGDQKIDNSAYKHTFGKKAKMLSYEELVSLVGHEPGGVCPFGINEGVDVYLDDSLKEYEVVYPACGSENSAVELTIAELEKASNYKGWVHVTKKIELAM